MGLGLEVELGLGLGPCLLEGGAEQHELQCARAGRREHGQARARDDVVRRADDVGVLS